MRNLKRCELWALVLPRLLRRPLWYARIQRWPTRLLGPLRGRSHGRIQIDITYRCHVACSACNRSCSQAPSDLCMAPEQVLRFVNESVVRGIRWREIAIAGGEPALHPRLSDIIDVLLTYKAKHSPATELCIMTSGQAGGHGLQRIPAQVRVLNSTKRKYHEHPCPFNVAPADCGAFRFADYTNACWIVQECGIGLTPFGYYHCAVAGAIDRVWGYDCGRKQLPVAEDTMVDQMEMLCRLCGHFWFRRSWKAAANVASVSWQEAYVHYRRQPPRLSPY